MADAKKAGARTSTKSVRKSKTPKPAALAEARETVRAVEPPPAAETAQASAKDPNEVLRASVSEAARGALELNEKILDALQAQGHAVLDTWRRTLNAPRLSEAILAQTSGVREAYETASAHWKDITETTARLVHKSLEPLQSALHRQDR
ncbi:phasin family protein [Microvirga terricola]|uniref:Phasin family protein n=1 Tax=Microvirga terricola TaxID=2719797 RepID=A0ABX0VE12_9HYPH|nr:phasin family protein [Microvirga terricola]NIX78074.1 phasin family protein [Microvirga terricola]